MAQKNNIRSIRFSDEMAQLIDQQVGDNFSQKFENLVQRCVWELPHQEKRLEAVQAEIKREQERLYNLRRATEQLRQLEKTIKSAQQYMGYVEQQAKQIAEAAEKDAL